METGEIGNIRARVRELVEALQNAEADELARRMEAYALGFTHVTEVRRAVSGIAQQLAYWRETGDELPDSASVQIAANRLEDACQAALKRGVIVPARPSLRAQAKRTFTVAATALAIGLAVLAGAVALVMFGVDVDDFEPLADLPPVELARGAEAEIELRTAAAPLVPEQTTGVEITPSGGCQGAGRQRGACVPMAPQLWSSGRHPTFELRLPNQAYGLQFAIAEVSYQAPYGRAKLLVSAAEETPEGTYRIALEAAYIGYAPACPFWKEPLGWCEAPTDPPRHSGLPMPAAVVRVGPVDPEHQRSQAERKRREAEERKRRAEERAAQIAEVLEGIEAELVVTDKILRRKKFEQAAERIEKLAALFEPLDALAAEQLQEAALPEGVADVRAHYDDQRAQLAKFDDRVFDAAFDKLHGAAAGKRPQAELIHRVARQLRVSDAYVEAVYTARPGEIEDRLTAISEDRRQAQARAAEALQARCGPLPKGSWKLVSEYLSGRMGGAGQRVSLGECMTPRLTERHCWQITCDYRVARERDRGRQVARVRAAFHVRDGRVTGHGDPI